VHVVALAATPAAGLSGTRHDFAYRTMFLETQTAAAGGPGVPGGVGLCTYCHTPHSASSTALLWNHTLSASTFTWSEVATGGGTPYPTIGPTYRGPTVKCLSCHDPHNRQTSDDLFLRGKLSGSDKASGYLCSQCHVM